VVEGDAGTVSGVRRGLDMRIPMQLRGTRGEAVALDDGGDKPGGTAMTLLSRKGNKATTRTFVLPTAHSLVASVKASDETAGDEERRQEQLHRWVVQYQQDAAKEEARARAEEAREAGIRQRKARKRRSGRPRGSGDLGTQLAQLDIQDDEPADAHAAQAQQRRTL
jgi:hypothetical protein